MRLFEELNQLHVHSVETINLAVARDDFPPPSGLRMPSTMAWSGRFAIRENRANLLPMRRSARVESWLRRMVRRLRADRAA